MDEPDAEAFEEYISLLRRLCLERDISLIGQLQRFSGEFLTARTLISLIDSGINVFAEFEIFNDAEAVHAWGKSHFAEVVATTTATFFANAINETDSRQISIVDLGVGDGRLLHALLHRLNKRIDKLVIIDKNNDCLLMSQHHLRHMAKSIDAFCSDFSLFPFEQKLNRQTKYIYLASASLHHLPHERKLKFAQTIPNAEMLLVAELESEHDRLPFGSKKLIRNAVSFYEALMKCVSHAKMSSRSRNLCLQRFIGPEFFNIIFQPRKSRQNYQTTEGNYFEIFCGAGFKRSVHSRLLLERKAPFLLLQRWNRQNVTLNQPRS